MSTCFPSSAQVQLASGESRQVSNLKPYDQIQTIGLDKDGKEFTRAKQSPFFTYLHFDKDLTAEFLVLNCENDTQLVISEGHLLFKKSTQGAVTATTMAKNVEIGDYLLHVNANKAIENVKVIGIERTTSQGIFAPLTKSGTLIVNGFLVSCYAHVDSQVKAHVSMAPLRLWYKLNNSKIGDMDMKPTKNGMHGYAKTLASIYGLS